MKFYTILAASVLLIAGCSDSSVTELDQNNNEDRSKIINEEPPELVAAYNDLWMEISYEHSQGILDTTKVLKANRIAVELSKYDGPMQQAFEIIEIVHDGHEAGKSMKQIKQEVRELTVINSRLIGSHCYTEAECEKCKQGCDGAYKDRELTINLEFTGEATKCIGTGLGGMLTSPNLLGVLGGVAYQLGCIGYDAFLYTRKVSNNKSTRDRCLDHCKPPKPE